MVTFISQILFLGPMANDILEEIIRESDYLATPTLVDEALSKISKKYTLKII